eukprot:CAMPEP_0118680598 /NCGR_PEP_ID=MMETSP0800-20121206/4455_1 /TAXON_ID=210618 ORGANISM="Striatella unipunctata, Strain CCMP2910" /NCGR_SAMPLE_ID=MMETSP0800 /ASSEMBLY_ACC=CAM_ASM_000638 /LENGTH=80 /DNA_ID=CAMNT_0006576767 /DNA_START=549 /DNA_END=791 /DNA_ORIENTATION=+
MRTWASIRCTTASCVLGIIKKQQSFSVSLESFTAAIVLPRRLASMPYSTWRNRPSAEKVVMDRSYRVSSTVRKTVRRRAE